MEEFNGSTLTSNILAFGIITLLIVVLRLSFRLHTRKTSASDWVLLVALVILTLLFTSSERSAKTRKIGMVVLMELMIS